MIIDVVKSDMKILKKYSTGKDVDPADEARLDELAAIGLVRNGLSIKRKKITAKTTPAGRGLSGNWLSRLL